MSSESQDAKTEQNSTDTNEIHVQAAESLHGAKTTASTALTNVIVMGTSLASDFKNWTAAKTSSAVATAREYATAGAETAADYGRSAAQTVADAADGHMGKIAGASVLTLIVLAVAWLYSRD
jgi:aspartate oxidase